MRVNGTAGPVLRTSEPTWDPQNGHQMRFEYEGTKDSIWGLYQAVLNANGVTSVEIRQKGGPVYSLSYRFAYAETLFPEETALRISLRTEIIQKDIFNHPTYVNAMAGLSMDQKLRFRKDIETAVSEGDETDLFNDFVEPYVGYGQDLAGLLVKGTTHYEDEAQVLSITRSISPQFSDGMTIYSTRYIYSTGQLPIPNNYPADIPDNTALAPIDGAVWGWRLRDQESEWTGGKLSQTHSFILAAWSTLLYPVAPGGDFSF